MKYIAVLLLLLLASSAHAANSAAPFQYCQTKTVSATSTTSSAAFTGACITTEQVRVVNVGPNTAFFRCGVGAQTAVTTDVAIPSGIAEIYTKGSLTDTCAAITSGANTATLYFTAGTGD